MSRPSVAIIGAGRMGQGFAIALRRRGYAVTLVSRTPRDVIPPLTLHAGDLAEAVQGSELVLVATPDDAIAEVAGGLADTGVVGHEQVVLHLSGLLDRTALEALAPSGAALGSFHPLQTVADPLTAADRLKGAYVGVEGDDRAVVAAERLAGTLRMIPVRLEASAKPAYHAAATIASNYTVALMALAERLAAGVGIAPDVTPKMFLPLLQGAAANVASLGVEEALTGPVRRGDVGTIRSHLAALGPEDRDLYRRLGLAALEVARRSGLSEERAAAVAKELGGKR